MKVFQILDGFCYNDVTKQFNCLRATEGCFTPETKFAEAPDYVFEGWGYDETKEGDERFIKPEAPDGWLYDEGTGTFYQEGQLPQSKLTPEAKIATLEEQAADTDAVIVDQEYRITLLELGLNESEGN